MFPTGLPGVGLIAVRVTVAAMLLVNESPSTATPSMGREIGPLVAAVCLVIGILTPYAATFAGCLEFWRLCARDSVDLFHLTAALVARFALGVLGPRAYSSDHE